MPTVSQDFINSITTGWKRLAIRIETKDGLFSKLLVDIVFMPSPTLEAEMVSTPERNRAIPGLTNLPPDSTKRTRRIKITKSSVIDPKNRILAVKWVCFKP
jgi:hypothetical protein